jgi:hypothetical protein
MSDTRVTFRRDDDGAKQLAIYLATLVKEGVEYSITNAETYVAVRLTGGF